MLCAAGIFFLWSWVMVNWMSFYYHQATHPYVHLLALAGLAFLQAALTSD